MTDLYITSHLPGKTKEREPYVEEIPFQTGIKPSMKVIPLFFEKNTGAAQESEYPKSGVKILKPVLCSALLDHTYNFSSKRKDFHQVHCHCLVFNEYGKAPHTDACIRNYLD